VLRVPYGKEAGLLFLIALVTLLVTRLVSSLVFVFFEVPLLGVVPDETRSLGPMQTPFAGCLPYWCPLISSSDKKQSHREEHYRRSKKSASEFALPHTIACKGPRFCFYQFRGPLWRRITYLGLVFFTLWLTYLW